MESGYGAEIVLKRRETNTWKQGKAGRNEARGGQVLVNISPGPSRHCAFLPQERQNSETVLTGLRRLQLGEGLFDLFFILLFCLWGGRKKNVCWKRKERQEGGRKEEKGAASSCWKRCWARKTLGAGAATRTAEVQSEKQKAGGTTWPESGECHKVEGCGGDSIVVQKADQDIIETRHHRN